MFVSTLDGLPNGSLLQQLSAGATKLLLAVMAEPDAQQARYIELVGYCERSVRNFGHELLALGLVRRTTAVTDGQAHDPLPKPKAQADQPLCGLAGEQSATSQTASAAPTEAAISRGSSHRARRARQVAVDADPLADLNEVQTARYDQLRAEGVDRRGARNLAKMCDDGLIRAAIAYVANRQPQSRTRYLVWCLRNPDKWRTGTSSAPTVGLNEAVTVPSPAEPILEMSVTDEVPMQTAEPVMMADTASAQADPDRQLVSVPTSAAEQIPMTGLLLSEDNLETVLLAYAVEAATGADLRLNVEARRAVQALQQAGYTPEDVGRFSDEVFPETDWRGQNHERPTPTLLLAGIAAVRHGSVSYRLGGLYERIRAIRKYPPTQLSLHHLSDLWKAAEEAMAGEERRMYYCPVCDMPISLCRCACLPADDQF